MFKVGDLVQHKLTKITGKVIGYGERKFTDGYYLTTLKVELRADNQISPIAEDLPERWQARQNRRILACTLPHFPKGNLSKIARSKASLAR